MTDEEAQGGRIFFSSTGRSLVDEDELVVLSVGVDIGSSTSHLVFSRIVLERLDSRYVVTIRETFYQSDILLTPYAAEEEIDPAALGAFIERQYQDAKVDPDEIDTGALILTRVAVRRRNARKIGDPFARPPRKLGAVAARSRRARPVAARSVVAAARPAATDFFRRRRRLHLWPRSAGIRRSRRAAGARNSRPRGRMGADARARERRHPCDRDRRLAIHHAGERQHHLRRAARSAPPAQRAGDRAGLRARPR